MIVLMQHYVKQMNLLGIISDVVEGVPIDEGISVKYRSVMGVELPKIEYEKHH